MTKTYKAIAIMGVVSFPNMPITCDVRKPESKNSILEAYNNREEIVLVTQTANVIGDDFLACVNKIGTVCKITKVNTDKAGNVRLIADGLHKVKLLKVCPEFANITVECERMEAVCYGNQDEELLFQSVKSKVLDLGNGNFELKAELLSVLNGLDDVNTFVDYSAVILLKDQNKQLALLNDFDSISRLTKLSAYVDEEMEILKLNKRLSDKVKQNMDKSQKVFLMTMKRKSTKPICRKKSKINFWKNYQDWENFQMLHLIILFCKTT